MVLAHGTPSTASAWRHVRRATGLDRSRTRWTSTSHPLRAIASAAHDLKTYWMFVPALAVDRVGPGGARTAWAVSRLGSSAGGERDRAGPGVLSARTARRGRPATTARGSRRNVSEKCWPRRLTSSSGIAVASERRHATSGRQLAGARRLRPGAESPPWAPRGSMSPRGDRDDRGRRMDATMTSGGAASAARRRQRPLPGDAIDARDDPLDTDLAATPSHTCGRRPVEIHDTGQRGVTRGRVVGSH